MDNNTFLKAALMTFSNRPAQLGLRRVAGNKARTHLMHASFGLHNEITELMTVLTDWISGASQWKDSFQAPAKDELGDVGYFLRILAKYLKVKLPSSTKKVKLKGMTSTQAILRLNTLAANIASLQKKNFYGPVMKLVDQNGVVVTTAGEGVKQVVDAEASAAQEALRNDKAKALVEEFVPLYWALSFQLFGHPPSVLFEQNIEKLKVRYPEGFFDALAEANKNPVAEAAAQA